jgi:hypothetical protein
VRTVIPPQFTGEDLQRLLTLALTAPAGDGQRSGSGSGSARRTGSGQPPDAGWRPEPGPDPAATTDAWDEPW